MGDKNNASYTPLSNSVNFLMQLLVLNPIRGVIKYIEQSKLISNFTEGSFLINYIYIYNRGNAANMMVIFKLYGLVILMYEENNKIYLSF